MKRILTLLLIAAAILTSQTYTFADLDDMDIAFAILSNSAPIVGESIHTRMIDLVLKMYRGCAI